MVKQMKASDIREKTELELQKELSEKKTELFKLRFRLATNQLENPMEVRKVRKDIAKLQTILRERELNGISM